MGIFITVEGIEGSGKSTLISALTEFYCARMSVVATREPGATVLGKRIRKLILQREVSDPDIDPLAEVLLFAADRAQHCKTFLRDAIKSTSLVLCDRYTDSTLAYQGYGAGLSLEILRAINHIATDGLNPDLVLLLDIDPQLSLGRAKNRLNEDKHSFLETSSEHSTSLNDSWNHFEKQNIEFHSRVRRGFLALAKSSLIGDGKKKFCIIDAESSREEIFNQARKAIDSVLSEKGHSYEG